MKKPPEESTLAIIGALVGGVLMFIALGLVVRFLD